MPSAPPPQHPNASPAVAADPLSQPVQYVRGVGPKRAALLSKLNLHTVTDLLWYLPVRYEDRATFQTIASLRPCGAPASILGEIVTCGIRPTRRPRFKIFEMLLRDPTGSLRAVWFNQPFLTDVFRPRQRVILFGKLEFGSFGLQLQNPQYEILPDEGEATSDEPRDEADPDDRLHTGRIVPIYEKTGTVTTKMQRVLVHHVDP